MDQLFLCPISKEEFYKEIGNIVDEKFRNLIGKTDNQNPISENKYLTRQEACQILRISLPTLGSYTKKGIIKKTSLEQYSRPRQNGIVAITIKEDDELLEARLTSGNSQIMLAVKSGKAIRFPEDKVRAVGRSGSGVRGISLDSDKDEVIGMIAIENPLEETVLVVSENGYGKRTFIDEPETGEAVYRITNRGGKGVKTISITEKTGNLVAIKSVLEEDDLMIINKSGMAIRLPVSGLRVMGRATQGVRLINIKGNDSIAAVAKVMKEDEDENATEEIENPTEE